jgi:hypothetical protein
MMSIRNSHGALLEPQQVRTDRALTASVFDHRQELPFCGSVQGQYISWQRTVYVQTPIDKLPQARRPPRSAHLRNRIALARAVAVVAHSCRRASPCSSSSATTRTRASEAATAQQRRENRIVVLTSLLLQVHEHQVLVYVGGGLRISCSASRCHVTFACAGRAERRAGQFGNVRAARASCGACSAGCDAPPGTKNRAM